MEQVAGHRQDYAGKTAKPPVAIQNKQKMASATTGNSVGGLASSSAFADNATWWIESLVNSSTSSPALSAEERRQVEQYAATVSAVKHSYMWLIFAFGFPGNLLSLVIILRLRSFGSPALYVATLAVVDNMAIVVKLLLLQFGEHKVGCRRGGGGGGIVGKGCVGGGGWWGVLCVVCVCVV